MNLFTQVSKTKQSLNRALNPVNKYGHAKKLNLRQGVDPAYFCLPVLLAPLGTR